jgi:hypothetical protein
MKLCIYGCGQEATYQFKNGKWCCSKSKNSCPNNKNIGENNGMFGNLHSNETKTKMAEKATGRIPWNKGKKEIYSIEIIEKLKNYRIGKKLSEETKIKIGIKSRNIKANLGKKFSNDWKTKMSESHKKNGLDEKQRQYMLKGGAIHALSFISNPSKPQVELYNRIRVLYPNSILNYPCYELNFSLDIAIPELNIWFESDGSYWHQDKEKDLKRQEKIENLGWKVIRYKIDYIKEVPTIEQIKQDIEKIKIIKGG